MERIANTLLPARMFVLCTAVCCGNGFKSAKAKVNAYFFSKLLCAELEALWSEVLTEWNSAGDRGFIYTG